MNLDTRVYLRIIACSECIFENEDLATLLDFFFSQSFITREFIVHPIQLEYSHTAPADFVVGVEVERNQAL